MGDLAIRTALILAGLACVACEVWGSFDFMWEKYGRWNYLVVGSLVLTGLSAVLPLAAEYAHRRNMTGLKWGAWLAVPLALAFVFTVSIQRTGSSTDTDETARQQIATSKKTAEKAQAEAEAQLPIDKSAVKRNCDVWGPICDKAKADQRATEKKLADARAVLMKAGVEVDDSMAKRLVAYLPFLNKEQVQLYQPMLLPLGLAIVGSLLIAIGARRSQNPVARLDTAAEQTTPENATLTAVPPATPRPKLVASNTAQPIGSVTAILTDVLEPAKGQRVELGDVYAVYATECRVRSVRALSPEDFVKPFERFCRGAGLRNKTVGQLVYVLDVRRTEQAHRTALRGH